MSEKTMQNKMRDRLVELLEQKMHPYLADDIADYLIENGVIVPPCKVGDKVWFNTFKKNATVCVGIQPHTVDRIDVICVCDTKNLVETNIRDWEFGKTVFLTKEECLAAITKKKAKNYKQHIV